jgi:hypothetical protein
MEITRVLKPKEINSRHLVYLACRIIATSRADETLLDLVERLLDLLVEEGIVG